MGERRIKAALREATETQHVNIGAGALASVPGVFRESFDDSPAVVVALYDLVLERDLGDIETLRDSWPTRKAMERSVRAQYTSPDLQRGAVEQTLAKHISGGNLLRGWICFGMYGPDCARRLECS